MSLVRCVSTLSGQSCMACTACGPISIRWAPMSDTTTNRFNIRILGLHIGTNGNGTRIEQKNQPANRSIDRYFPLPFSLSIRFFVRLNLCIAIWILNSATQINVTGNGMAIWCIHLSWRFGRFFLVFWAFLHQPRLFKRDCFKFSTHSLTHSQFKSF